MISRRTHRGFTLIELIIVIVISGVIGSIISATLKAPVDQYLNMARRADMTDIADTALRRISRDLRLALPNSVRVTNGTCPSGSGTCNFLEFLPTSAGGRYRVGSGGGASCPGSPGDEALDFTTTDACAGVLGGMPPSFVNFTAGDRIAIYNLGIPGADAYSADNTAAINVAGSTAAIIKLNAGKQFPFESPFSRFDIINQAVSYVCDTTAHTLMRYSYAIVATQPTSTLSGGNLMAGNVGSTCNFAYDPLTVAQRYGMVTMRLAITKDPDTVTLYSATHVSNVP